MSKKPHGSVHHIIPISRGGKRIPENELKIDSQVHDAWHVLFGNLLVEEVITLIKYAWQEDSGRLKDKYLWGQVKTIKGKEKDKRLFAWRTVFGDIYCAKEAIKTIKDKFTKRT